MKKMKDVYFMIAWIASLVMGIIYCVTVVGAVIGVPLLIAYTKFKDAKEMNDELLIQNRGSLLGWGIFVAIALAPTIIGLIAMLVFVFMVNDYIKNLEQGNVEKTEKGFGETVKDGASNTWTGIKEFFGGKSKLEKEKEKLAELEKMKEDGIITEEEYQAKRKQILGL